MEQFRKKTVHFASSDEGVKVAELITLVDNNPLAKEILKLLDVKSILGEIIQIPVQSPNQKIPDRKTKCVIETHLNIKQNVIFGANLKPV